MGLDLRVGLVLGTSTGGIGRHVRALAAGLQLRGASVIVCAPRSVEDAFGFTGLGARFAPVPIGKGWRFFDPRTVGSLRASLSDVDLVHAHGLRPGITATSARRSGQPLVVTWHNAVLGSATRRRVLARQERAVAKSADLMLGASQDLVDRAIELGARDARLTMLPAPELTPATRSSAEVRAELGIGDEPVVLTVARLVPQKRLNDLVDAATILARADVDVTFLVVGNGRLHDELTARIKRDNVPMRLLGERNDIADLLLAADVFALSSEWEARSFAVQEAMWSGCPVVVPAVGGLTELVGDAGILVRPKDSHSLATGIRQLVEDPVRRTALSGLARERAAGWPGEGTIIDETIERYLALTG